MLEGLSDQAQAILSLVSAILIAVGGVSAPTDWRIGFALGICGAVGFSIKEALGGKK